MTLQLCIREIKSKTWESLSSSQVDGLLGTFKFLFSEYLSLSSSSDIR